MTSSTPAPETSGFLSQVAAYYSRLEHLENYCFLFPNRRSGQFFARELQQQVQSTCMLPLISSMDEWVCNLTRSIQVSPIEAMFLLYSAYAELLGERAASMDHFVFWGNIILSDFDEADANLIDTRSLYTNLSQLREIGTDHLSPEVKAAVERMFNIGVRPDNDRFWLHQRANNTDVMQEYVTLWNSLADLHDHYHQKVEQQGLVTNGRMMQLAVTLLNDDLPPEELPWAKVVFVGFASLSQCERHIMNRLKTMGKADFWWDDASPFLRSDGRSNPGAELIARLRQTFGQPADLAPITTQPRIEKVKVGTYMSQVKCAASMVKPLINGLTEEQATRTAIVMPDKNLLIPLVNSLSTGEMPVNITMGYELRLSNIVSLMRLVARAHRHATHNKTTGVWTYYREDVLDILSHPIIKGAFTGDAVRLINDINHRRIFNVEASMLRQTSFGLLFTPLQDVTDSNGVLEYVDRLARFATQLARRHEVTRDEDNETMPLQTAFISQYVQQLETLKAIIKRYRLPLSDDGIFYLIDRLTGDQTIAFSGEPLRGLQVMGMLETRCIDFDHIIILSCNDRDFPGAHNVKSFIPHNLRRAFGLKVTEDYEVEMAYYFYRLIGRADTVSMVYSVNNVNGGNAEPSRFINQLALAYRHPVHEVEYTSSIDVFKPINMVVPKTFDLSKVFVENRRYLSASVINEFINCGLQFYFHQIERLNNDNEQSDFMDAATYGTIIHDTLQELYYPQGPRRVTKAMIDDFERNRLETVLTRNINSIYRHMPDDAALDGDAYILFETMTTYVKRVTGYDKQFLTDDEQFIEVLECEESHKMSLDLGEDLRVAFTYKADRIDRLPDGRLRIIDYKTGNDPTHVASIANLFNVNREHRPKAILQMLLYCNAYHQQHPDETEIMPVIYKMRKMQETQVAIGSKAQYIFRPDDPFNIEFLSMMRETIARLLSPDEPFAQCPDSKGRACDYCRFIDFCRR